MFQDDGDQDHLKEITSKLNELEQRLSKLEKVFDVKPDISLSTSVTTGFSAEYDSELNKLGDSENGFESRIGGYGLALIGTVVLLFGISFLHQYIINSGMKLFAAIFGYVAVASIFLLARFLHKKVSHLTFMLNMVGQFLLYYVTMRLHYFDDAPLIQNEILSVALIFGVIIYQLIISVTKKSELYACIALVLMMATGTISNTTHFMLALTTFAAGGVTYFFFRYRWKVIVFLSMFLVYFTFLMWFLLNPFNAHNDAVAVFHNYSHIYLFLCAALFSQIALAHQRDVLLRNIIITAVLFNGICFSAILLIFIPTFFSNNYPAVFLVIAVYCTIFSIVLRYRSAWRFAPAFYAMFGFLAFSFALYGMFKLPYIFLLLTLQSLYVVIIALWFRSQLLIIMNVVLFILCLITYLFASASVDIINFSFPLVAIASAKIINWKKDLLQIKTDLIRNLYLVITFFTVLLSLYRALPAQYVTLSWTIAAIVYFLLSILLKNVKYRWMAIATMLSAAVYLVIVDLARISIVYRIIAFMFLAIISISISLFYNRIKKKTDTKDGQ